MQDIEEKISELRNNLKTDRLDMSFGEIMNLYYDGELIIKPEYQRSYRWKPEQKTRFIESLLLGIPIPPIFVAEDENGVWELVDGLQRISTILSFFGLLEKIPEKNNLKLTSAELIGDILKDKDINSLSIKLKNSLKRTICRVEILRSDSTKDMRYELFNRLNTGATPLSSQEIRNCIFIGDFNSLLIEIAKNGNFQNIISPTDRQTEEMFLEELVLRHFAVKYHYNDLIIQPNMSAYLTSFMKKVKEEPTQFNYSDEKEKFERIVQFINENIERKIFRARNGIFTPNLYDTIMFCADCYYEQYKGKPEEFEKIITQVFEDEVYKKYAGKDTGTSQRMKKKIERAKEIFDAVK